MLWEILTRLDSSEMKSNHRKIFIGLFMMSIYGAILFIENVLNPNSRAGFSELKVLAYSIGDGESRKGDNLVLAGILSDLSIAPSLGSGGSKFESCGESISVTYETEDVEMFEFYTRYDLDGCVLAKSDYNHLYYESKALLKFTHDNQ